MTDFYYEAITSADAVVTGTSNQTSEQSLLVHLRSQGLRPLKVRRVRQQNLLMAFRRQKTLSKKEFLAVVESLATLLASSVTLERSLEIVAQNEAKNSRTRKLLQQTLSGVRAGHSLADSLMRTGFLEEQSSKTILALVAAGEASGSLSANLRQAADLLAAQLDFEKRIKDALTYPMIVSVTALFTLIFMGAVIAPAFEQLFEGTGRPLPYALLLLMQFSDAVPGLLLALLSMVLLSRTKSAWLAHFRSTAERLALGFPIISPKIVRRDVSSFCFLLAVLLEGGVGLIPALRLSVGGIRNGALSKLVADTIEHVRDGQALSETLGSLPIMPPLFKQLTSVGEENGALAPMLHQISNSFRTSLEDQLERVSAILSPVLICLLGGLVAILMASIFGAILEINDLAG